MSADAFVFRIGGVDEDVLYHIGFSHFFGIGPRLFTSLVRIFGSTGQAYNAQQDALVKIVGPSLADRFSRFRKSTDLRKLREAITAKGITVLCRDKEGYPESLRLISDAPICLYVKGDSRLVSKTGQKLLAVVGTRNPTSYGVQITRHFSYSLAQDGFAIVSGMALGIDAIAHEAALEAGGATIAVLGCGVDIIYPPSHSRLYHRIIESGGAILSEFPPGHTVRRGLFVVRNRIISGLSAGVLVIEGTERSGTLTTAKYAADQGKPVFAPPVPITSYVSRAPNLLLKQGAVLVTEIGDILYEFGLVKQKQVSFDLSVLTDEEKGVVLLLQKEDCSVDDMVMRLQMTPPEISMVISRLEMQNLIEKDEAGNYRLVLVK